MATLRECCRAKRVYDRFLLDKANVVSVGVGYKIIDGAVTGHPAVLVGVSSKKTLESLAPEDVIPPLLDGIPTDVIQRGVFTSRVIARSSGSPPKPFFADRPAPAGVSCGHRAITAGTLGLWVGRSDDLAGWYLLSNNHILANENKAEEGDPIFQPGPYDGGRETDIIAQLTAFIPIRFGSASLNECDAAIGRIVDPAFALNSVLGLTPIAGLHAGEILPGMRVLKTGRTTGTTNGIIEELDVTVRVGYDSGEALFVDQLMITPGTFSAPGDSGSSIWTEDMQLVGLLFAGSSEATVISPHGNFFPKLGINLKLPLNSPKAPTIVPKVP